MACGCDCNRMGGHLWDRGLIGRLGRGWAHWMVKSATSLRLRSISAGFSNTGGRSAGADPAPGRMELTRMELVRPAEEPGRSAWPGLVGGAGVG